MISTGRAEGQSGACVLGYIRVYHEAASRSRPFSLGRTTCRGVPAMRTAQRCSQAGDGMLDDVGVLTFDST